jgi:N6-L-threonylcarbamoyladenine synthase
MKDIYILGIETSCDETGIGIVRNGRSILSNVISSSAIFQKEFGGIVPEVAARKQLEFIIPTLDKAFKDANVGKGDIDGIAISYGPGLEGSLLVGLIAAKVLALSLGVPLIGINHLEGHIFSALADFPTLEPPFLSLLVSGGHTALVIVTDYGNYEVLGDTLDDAAGEAFDKVAKLLGLGYPGGPIIDKIAKEGDPKKFNFPRADTGKNSLDFSFSGLKTSVKFFLEKNKNNSIKLEDIAASFQEAVVDAILVRVERAIKKTRQNKLVLGGGVSANSRLREKLRKLSEKLNFQLYLPSLGMCTDNGAMIAIIGYYYYINSKFSTLDLDVDSSLNI